MIETVVRNALKSIMAGRLYRVTFMQKDGGLPQWPAGRFAVTDTFNEPDICGTDTTDTDNTTVQIDLVAQTAAELDTIEPQVIAALQNLDPPARRDSMFKTFDEATRTYRTVLIYEFHASSPVTS